MKKALKIIGIILLVIAVIFGAYAAYVFISYHREGDTESAVEGEAEYGEIDKTAEYTVVSYNVGFGAYESDFGFFMDGGDRAWAWSEERLDKNLKNIAELLKEQNADFYLIQEVDTDSTRSYHVDERRYFTDALKNKEYTFANNFDSPYLCYPFTQPHGTAKSGIMTFSRYDITSSNRVELPVEAGVMKIIDLDRCYSKNRLRVSDGKELIVYNFHLSAYTSDGKIANDQLKKLLSDMQYEYDKGNYCVAGGDFNKDILGDSSVYFGKAEKTYTWAQPIPDGMFNGFTTKLYAPLDVDNPVPSCRNADSEYHKGQLILTIDGFLMTDNLTHVSSEVIDTGFAYSDHNPVKLTFKFAE